MRIFLIKPYPIIIAFSIATSLFSQPVDPYKPDFSEPVNIPGMTLVWNDEFNINGKPDPTSWGYERGFVRNRELQWYQSDNAICSSGVLLITARRDTVKNPNYNPSSTDWKRNREYAYYTSSCLKTAGKKKWKFGSIIVRARIDSSKGSWPAIWTLGTQFQWPSCGEVDIMEFYRISNVCTILANFAWGTNQQWGPKWNTETVPLSEFCSVDPDWPKKFHIWRLDWNKDTMKIILDNKLLNDVALDTTLNADGSNPFLQSHYLLLNLAIGANGGDPSRTKFPITYEVDYARVYQGTPILAGNDAPTVATPCRITACFSNNSLDITILNKAVEGTVRVSLFAFNGRIIAKKTAVQDCSKNSYRVNVSKYLKNGLYIIRVAMPDIHTLKIYVMNQS